MSKKILGKTSAHWGEPDVYHDLVDFTNVKTENGLFVLGFYCVFVAMLKLT